VKLGADRQRYDNLDHANSDSITLYMTLCRLKHSSLEEVKD